jgi:hypothetical protein
VPGSNPMADGRWPIGGRLSPAPLPVRPPPGRSPFSQWPGVARVAESRRAPHEQGVRDHELQAGSCQRGKGGAEPPLPALRRQAPQWARGWVGDPRARSRTPPTSAPFAKKVGS